MSTFLNDIKFAFRQLGKHTFTNGVIVLTIALLITGVSVFYASFLGEQARWVPFPESDRMVKLWRSSERMTDWFPGDLYVAYSERLNSVDGLCALTHGTPKTLTHSGEPVSYGVTAVSVNLLAMTGIPPLRGRLFQESDLDPGGETPIIISEQMWRGKLGSDEAIIGRRLILNDQTHVVVGVMPESMRTTRLSYNVDIWTARRFTDDARNLQLFARLKEGFSLAQANAEMKVLAPHLEKARTPIDYERHLSPSGFQGGGMAHIDKDLQRGSQERQIQAFLALAFSTIIIGCVVGISCFNVANLLLARVNVRSRELAIRSALGARRMRLMRLVLTESLLLSVIGGIAGLLVSWWLVGYLAWSQGLVLRLDARLFCLVALGACLLGVFVGLLPAMNAVRINLTQSLKNGGQSTGGRQRHRIRNVLVSSEIAMALVLCVVAGIMTRAYLRLYARDLGFDADRTLAVQVKLRSDLYPDGADRQNYAESVRRALQPFPGVESIAITTSSGLLGWSFKDEVSIASRGESQPVTLTAGLQFGSVNLARLYGMDIVMGRELSQHESAAAGEALVNETLVREYFSGRNPIGSEISVGRAREGHRPDSKTIVGVVRDRHPLTSYQPLQPEILLSVSERSLGRTIIFLVRTRLGAKTMGQAVHGIVQRLDSQQPVGQPLYVADLIEQRASGLRKAVTLLGALGGIGLFIALIGVYGVVAFSVQERTFEVGIRMAIGANRRDILRLMMWQGARLITFGVAPGMLIGSIMTAALPARAIGTGLRPFDPIIYLIVLGIVTITGLFAAYVPARRATSLKPTEALRYE